MTGAVLWDLDGTLLDSEDYHWRAWRRIMAAESRPITHRQFLDSFGQRNDRILRSWLGEDTSEERIRRIGDAKECEYRRLIQEGGIVPLPGAAEWVTRLHVQGWRQAIASSAPLSNVQVMLAALGLGRAFEVLVSAEDVTSGKPDPDVFLAAAQRLGEPAPHCIVVEDAAVGIEAARRAGMRAIGVNRSTPLDADVSVTSLCDLSPDAFSALLSRSNRV